MASEWCKWDLRMRRRIPHSVALAYQQPVQQHLVEDQSGSSVCQGLQVWGIVLQVNLPGLRTCGRSRAMFHTLARILVRSMWGRVCVQ